MLLLFVFTKSCPTLHNSMDCSTPVFPIPHHLLAFAQVHVHWIGDAIQPSHLLSPSSPYASIFPSSRVFSNESAIHISWSKYWSFSFSLSHSKEYSVLISFRTDWFDLAFQEILKSLFQHHSLKASILQCSAFFIVHISHTYMTTGKTITLTKWTFVGKVMSLLFNTLSRFVIALLPRSNHLLISWLQSPSQWF